MPPMCDALPITSPVFIQLVIFPELPYPPMIPPTCSIPIILPELEHLSILVVEKFAAATIPPAELPKPASLLFTVVFIL